MKDTPPTYGSVCSGIEAASIAWEPLGWKPLWFAEIEPFPSAVLAHHWPQVPNLGDFTRIKDGIAAGTIEAPDVIVGGTPCQSWSVAGLRKGSDDPRGQLTFAFVQLVEVAMPPAIVWENVPGILSAEGGSAFAQFLDALGALGYIVNCDILDAQFFGVAQRRRRVFVVCQRADILMSQRTATSWTTLAVLVVAILHDILDALLQESAKGHEPWEYLPESVCVGLRRKMQCFYRHGEEPLRMWPRNLGGESQNVATAPMSSESHPGDGPAMGDSSAPGEGTSSSGSSVQEEDAQLFAFLSTSRSWSRRLEDLLSTLNPSTISMVSRTTIESKIYSYVEILPIIAQSIRHLNLSSPGSLKLASSISTVLQKATRFANHARSASGDLFCDSWIPGPWSDFLQQAERASVVVASARTDCGPEVLFEFDGVRRDSPPSRQQGQGASTDAQGGTGAGSHWDGVSPHPSLTQSHNTGGIGQSNQELFSQQGSGLVPAPFADCADTLTASMSRNWNGNAPAENGSLFVQDAIAIQGSLVGPADKAGPSGPGYSDPGAPQYTLTKTDVHAVAFEPGIMGRLGSGHTYLEHSGTLRKEPGDNQMAVAFDCKASGSYGFQESPDTAGTLRGAGHGGGHGAVGIPATSPALRARDFKGQPEDVSEPSLIPSFSPPSKGDSLYIKGITQEGEAHGGTQKGNSGTVLCALREEIGEEAFAKWELGVLDTLQGSEVLRQDLHGEGVRFSAQAHGWLVGVPRTCEEPHSPRSLLQVWESQCQGRTPRRWESPEQLRGELGAYLQELSQSRAPATRFMHDLRNSSERIGVLREALPTLQKVGGSHDRKGQPAHTMQVRRLTPDECAILQGFPKGHTRIPWRKRPAEECPDGPQYKAYGNSMCTKVMRWIGNRLDPILRTPK